MLHKDYCGGDRNKALDLAFEARKALENPSMTKGEVIKNLAYARGFVLALSNHNLSEMGRVRLVEQFYSVVEVELESRGLV